MARVIHGDALRVLSGMDSRAVHGVFCDPPYSSGGAFRGDRMGGTSAKYGGEHFEDFAGDTRDQRGFLAWCSLWLAEAWRVAKDGAPIAVTIDWRQLPTMTDALQAGGWSWRGIVPWSKTLAARPQLGQPRNQCEYVLWGSKGPLAVYDGAPAIPGLFEQYLHANQKQHQADKPVALWRMLLAMVRPGGTVLDPFAGSGSLGVACALEGLDYIGVEVSEHWCGYARERIRAEGHLGVSVEAMRAGQGSLFEEEE